MQETLLQLRESGRISSVDDWLVPRPEIFRLVGEAELRQIESAFVPDAAVV